MTTEPTVDLDPALRATLADLADRLVPGDAEMPAPSAIDIGGAQLDVVAAARPDIAEPLRRGLSTFDPAADAVAWITSLRSQDAEAWEAVVLAIVGGYYVHPAVWEALGYPGQRPRVVPRGTFPDYLQEGLLERVYERGPRYRPTPAT